MTENAEFRMQLRYATMSIVALIVLAFALGRITATAPSVPVLNQNLSIGFSPARVELGEQAWNSDSTFSAVLIKRSEQELTIASIDTSCDCTLIDSSRYIGQLIAPGGKFQLQGTISFGTQLGERTSEAKVLLSNGVVYPFVLAFTVFATYTLAPNAVDFGTVDLDQAVSPDPQRVVLRARTGGKSVGIQEVHADASWMLLEVEERQADTLLTITVDPSLLSHGPSLGRVKIRTTDASNPDATIFVSVKGSARLRPLPSEIFLRSGKDAMVRFLNERGAAAKIKEIEADPPGVVEVRTPLPAYQIALSLVRGNESVHQIRLRVIDEKGNSAVVTVVQVAP